jgi:hypothetical protein
MQAPGIIFVKNDGSIICGNGINWKAGFLSKHEVDMDGQKFKIADVKGYQLKGGLLYKDGFGFYKKNCSWTVKCLH